MNGAEVFSNKNIAERTYGRDAKPERMLDVKSGRRKRWSMNDGMMSMPVSLLLYYISFSLFLVGNCVASTTAPDTSRFKLMCQVMAIVLLLLKLIGSNFGVKQIALFVPITLIFAYSGYISSDFALLWSWLFIVSGNGVSLQGLAKVALTIFSVSFFVTALMAVTGFIPNIVMIRTGTDTLRYALGYRHPNGVGKQIFEILAAVLVLHFPKFKFTDIILCVISFFAIWLLVDSRTSMMCVMLAMLIIALQTSGFIGRHEKGVLDFALMLFVLEVIFSIWSMCIGPASNGLLSALDKHLSNRIYYSNYYFSNYGISLFGQNLETATTLAGAGYYFEGYVIDNAYCHMLLVHGLVPFLTMTLLIGMCYLKMRKERVFTALTFSFVLFTFLGMTENSAMNFYTAYYLIGLCPVFFGTSTCEALGIGNCLSGKRHYVTIASEGRQ
jgi:hypothetical protein